jgi:hypothetical protein
MPKLINQPSIPALQDSLAAKSPVTHAKFKLSGAGANNSTILMASGAANQTTIHQCSPDALDEVYLWASVSGSTDAKAYISIDGSNASFINEITAQGGLVQIYPGVPHQGATITGWSNVAGVLRIFGYVARHYKIADYNVSFGYDGTE